MQPHKKSQNVAIVGITRETPELLSLLLDAEGIRIVRIINPDTEELSALRSCVPPPDLVVNSSDSAAVAEQLRRLRLPNADILGGLSARILFLSKSKGMASEGWSHDRSRILNSLYEIKQAVLLSKNKEELLKLLLRVAITTCRADSGSIMLVDTRKKFLKIEMADGLNFDIVKSPVQKFGKGVAGKVARTGQAMLIRGPFEGADERIDPKRPDLISSICCPLVIGSEVVGVLNINSSRPERVFNEADLKYIKELAEFTADVIRTSQQFETTSSCAFSLSVLAAAQEIMAKKYPLQERLNLLTMKIAHAFGAVICNYYEYSPEQRIFLIRASSSFNIDLLKGKSIKLNDVIAQKALRTRELVRLDAGAPGIPEKRWYIAAPILVAETIRAILFLHLVSDKKDIAEECKMITKISEMIANVLDNEDEKQLLEVQSTKLVAVSEASFNIASAHDLRELVNFALPNACLIMEAEASLFWLLDPVSDKIELFHSFSISSPQSLEELQRIDAMIFERSVPGDDVLLIRDLRKEGYAVSESLPHSVLSKAFGNAGRTAAILSLYGKRSPDLFGTRSFSQNDKEVFLKFCLQFSKGLAKLMPYFDEKR